MTLLYAVGGSQKADASHKTREFHHYASALIISLDTESGRLERLAEHVTPADACPMDEDPSITFKTATLEDGKLYVPTQTELLVYDVPSFKRRAYISLPCMNDVHHVRPAPDGTMYVANTGLDTVLQLAGDGTVLREWNVLGEDTWSRFSRDVDYRKVVSTKPHHSHPNHVFFVDGDVWVTRCNQHDAFCLTREQPPIPIAEVSIHDGGIRHGDKLYFTGVNGEVIVVDAKEKRVLSRHDLHAIGGGGPPLGWCRGIEVLGEDLVAVGFSRLRPTKWTENVRWVKHKLGGKGADLRPTRIGIYDLKADRLVKDIDLEPAGMNVVFSVHRVGT
jgi:hypothetical protein